ncbi:MAG: N-acetyl-gamma-glutamyl-phosphate reductase [Lentisphaerae bacterium]|jgi:N-acetyl-gamma-glutamyl-phosphate reductase|nr:N-acetyl-gamma-glutamyl-phosphate reductase [Lentisphaerota bacterium]MBT4815341.1 N-acetyl-gamma-glutamyl-phosphate reductase [Lentisphaerota bacterium]MBT5610119.1 N-acetyl-gamma-glutamyl-phosphate reductase [Lentisphaerota bacterium]MBT7053589.1 N-acetyl-gamma-glutamyl-phosphate reductase [Lentisphaerota bacterium]MBT7842107.1 N-acetyl-gamma-glutamyl-phosphate reductase [Lentisphaerota bacterium]
MDSTTIQVAIFGASGYSGEELLRLLQRHPSAHVAFVTSRQYAGQPIGTVFPRFAESSLQFCQPDVSAIAPNVDVAFLALPHGLATEYAIPLLKAGVRIIDISADFRLRSPAKYEAYYDEPHPAPELLSQAVYGLPERYRGALKGAQLVACPGCYPTSTILPLSPVLAAGLVDPATVIVSSMSGVSGAGRKVDLPYIFPECNESVRPYKVTGHRHLPEIEQELAIAAGVDEMSINFIPHLVPINRGIHSTIVANARGNVSAEMIGNVLNAAYADEPFVRVLPSGGLADTKHITATNVCEIGYAFDSHTGRVILSSAIDNLTKGASGQAVQCLNITCGFPETTGLL